ncbi:MAG: indole-3-glycerol-phosphate synthase, partial [Armatimonadetes bacterium]|nr:indole-3-glycerol-phosphate synthase [Armatimonadota bacterium]
ADAVLLIAAALRVDQLKHYHELALTLGLTPLVEVHTEREMETALAADATLIGINSRDLKRFVTDLAVVERLAAMVPEGVTLVAESGIKTVEDVARVARAGAHAILVGETLMRSRDIGLAVKALLGTA